MLAVFKVHLENLRGRAQKTCGAVVQAALRQTSKVVCSSDAGYADLRKQLIGALAVKMGVHIFEPTPCFREALPMVAQHHERFDRTGYPAGLGENISLHARACDVNFKTLYLPKSNRSSTGPRAKAGR